VETGNLRPTDKTLKLPMVKKVAEVKTSATGRQKTREKWATRKPRKDEMSFLDHRRFGLSLLFA